MDLFTVFSEARSPRYVLVDKQENRRRESGIYTLMEARKTSRR